MLSTKAISTLLTKEWFEIFTEWITYPTIVVRAASLTMFELHTRSRNTGTAGDRCGSNTLPEPRPNAL